MRREAKGEGEESMGSTNNETKAMGSPRGLGQSSSGSSSHHELGSPVMPDPSSPFLSHNAGQKLAEGSPLKQGHRSNLYAAKVSDLLKLNNLDVTYLTMIQISSRIVYTEVASLNHGVSCLQSSPTQTLLNVASGILNESIERKNGEIPQQNNIFRAREEKYQSRIRVLETLAHTAKEENLDLRVACKSIKQSIINAQMTWSDEMTDIGEQLKVLVDAAENYHAVLAENKKLFNEVQELRGNIRVYCRIRPFLPGENRKATIVDHIGDNGEILVANPSKQGKEKPRMFKFNKVFGPAASQAQVYLDIQPLIRSVLDGYNVCIFAGLAVPGANMLPVKSTSDVLELMQIGFANRAVGATALNSRSSRSHSVVTVHVRSEDLKTGSTSQGSLHLIDLAGSERADRSEATGDRLREAQHINKSLSALGDVIFALSQKSAHVPYRNSKLTQLLQSSLGGQAKTLMFVQVNPDVLSFSESLSTLKFAERVSGVELGAAKTNKEGKDVSDLMEQVASLKDTIARKDGEIEQLQQLKDSGNLSPGMSNGKLSSISLRHSSSSPGKLSLSGSQRSSGGMVKKASRSSLDTDNYSECCDGLSESSSQHSMDDFNQQENQSSLVDIELSGNGEAESEEKIGNVSDGNFSMGTGSRSSVSYHHEQSKSVDSTTDKTRRIPLRIPKPVVQKTRSLTPSRQRLKEPLKSPVSGLRKSISSPATESSVRAPKRGL
ncbi:hypothetical protein J5N97_004763 [Dioscorea zingiberensis]|uniref:Kinesin-like protein n=1 Tax=Dioscorea zingiberensis TaxID=325984 RepID=A0A9D5D8K8_9LILI|nr:hypothetical protein J5N97_004763 [Dioscorea zingiberensis]